MVMGRVNSINIGFKITFNIAKTIATIRASLIGSTRVTPGKILAIIKTATAVLKSLTISFFMMDHMIFEIYNTGFRKTKSTLETKIQNLADKMHHKVEEGFGVFGMKPMSSVTHC